MNELPKCLLISFVIYLYLYALHSSVNAVISVANNSDFLGTLLSSIVYVIKTFFVAVITHWIRLVRNPRLNCNLIGRWSDRREISRTRRARWLNYFAIWSVAGAAFLLRTGRMIVWLRDKDPQEYFTYSFYRVNLTALNWPEGVAKTVVAFDWTSYNLSFFVTATQFTSFLNCCGRLNRTFDAVSLAVREILDGTAAMVAPKRSAMIVKRFRVFDRRFAIAAEEFRSVEARFSLPLFLWISEAVAYVVLTSRRLKMTDFNRISIRALLIDSSFYTTIYVLVLINCARIDETHKEIRRRLAEKGVQIEPELYVQYDLTTKAVNAQRCCLTGFNFYYVDRAFGLTTVGMVFTYLVVVTQI